MYIFEKPKEIPVIECADVCVLGGGTTGVMAAIRAARMGASVVLVEQQGNFGGNATSGMVCAWHTMMDFDFNKQIIAGLSEEFIDRLKRRNAVRIVDPDWPYHKSRMSKISTYIFNTQELKIECDEMLLEAGVVCYLHTAFCSPWLEDGQLRAVIVENKDGRQAIKARFFIDATGDGDLAYRLGINSWEQDLRQPSTTAAVVTNYSSNTDPKTLLLEHLDEYDLPILGWDTNYVNEPQLRHLLKTNVFESCLTGKGMTCGEIEGRRQVRAIMDILNEYGDSDRPLTLIGLSSSIGIREGRHKIEFVDVPIPELRDDQVLIKVTRIGVCGSDIHVWHGVHPFTSYPVTQGHEVSGQIVALGRAVTEFHIGQKVTVQPQVTCGKCYPCRHGKYNLCEELKVMGFQTTGLASEYFAAPAGMTTPLPDELSYDEGAMIEPLAVAVHAVRRAGSVSGKKIAIIGAGPIGNLVAQVAKGLGADSVMIAGHGGKRADTARACGIDYVIDTRDKDFGEAISECFGPDKADVIFDCAGNDRSIGDAIKYARKGSEIILVAVFSKMANVDLAVLNDHEIDLNTSMMYRNEDYITAIELVASGKVSLKPLISNHFAFSDYAAAYEYIDENRREVMKVIIDIQD